MPLKSCQRCGKIHPFGECKVKRDYYHKTQIDSIRNTSAWQAKREEIKDKAMWLCEVCKQEGIYTTKGLEVHHITKLNDNEDLAFENENLIVLCKRHHAEADLGKLDPKLLRKLAISRETGDTPGIF